MWIFQFMLFNLNNVRLSKNCECIYSVYYKLTLVKNNIYNEYECLLPVNV